ncbi:hypothetical protein A3C23_04075 [Candidatus Roizmanbacteria bacterium RIFCSPHIGHO2_02_FULL_37_13b]|uniref:Uncharacterized protein n=1 Tax=Candidatus Roizmanbacteria bacterium RIFCSPLOWO2_02_FULL_36_11 TaxID=1802071 RepID=A0A1F7JH06_9BACT|nr:MAG: hypothetical protein A3C23_04075 [Candidatus Roizmanbacteria bacterium RIFCSPHIGHO2_02_FULL_37_13b]OGK54893.1 MAG: hypothetical protein A3H78_00220 [Candidatus Roizmanbacteria bacterium RIFCSPLOWO2_02_FULL_36_11]
MEENQQISQAQPIPSVETISQNINNKYFYSIIIVLVLLLFGAFGYIFLSRDKPSTTQTSEVSQSSIQPTQLIPTAQEMQKTTEFHNESIESNVYRLELRLKTGASLPLGSEQSYGLGNYLLGILELPKSENYSDVLNISYDTTKVKEFNKFENNNDYYVVLKKGSLIDNKIYEDKYSTIRVVKEDASLSAYLLNSDYCSTDNDCILRFNFCSYGSYNNFSNYADVWGCGPPSDETGYTYGICDENKKCITDVKFSGSKCIANKCVGQNREVTCKESCSETTNP